VFFIILPSTSHPGEAEESQASSSSMLDDKSYQDMVRSPEYLMLFVVFCFGIGTGLMFINNVGQILPAFGGSSSSSLVPAFVSMLSCFNGVGRLGGGFVSEVMTAHIGSQWLLVIALAMQIVGFLLLITVGAPLLWFAGGLVALAWGGLWTMVPVLIKQVWGPKDFSVKYAFTVLAGLLGSLLFSTLLAGRLYDREAMLRHEAPFCYAPSCYTATFTIAAVCDLLALVLAVVFCRWVGPVYAADSRVEGSSQGCKDS